MKEFRTPILYLVFNRPESTKLVIERIREIQPAFLYIAADGPRKDKPHDIEKCAEVKSLLAKEVDWPCEVKSLFRDANLGCRKAVSEGLDWFFENEEMGIILEDDVLPDASFFPFSAQLLDKYKEDYRIFSISGTNYNLPNIAKDYSYFFSKYVSIWGWASWADRWKLYKATEKVMGEVIDTKDSLRPIFQSNHEVDQRNEIFKKLHGGNIDTWDYVWSLANYIHNGLTIIPRNNLVRNIGFDADATHTKDQTAKYANLVSAKMDFPLNHPPYIMRSFRYENSYYPQTKGEYKYSGGTFLLRTTHKILSFFHKWIIRNHHE